MINGECGKRLLFVTVVTLPDHVDNVFAVAVNVMINKSSFAGRIKCIIGNIKVPR